MKRLSVLLIFLLSISCSDKKNKSYLTECFPIGEAKKGYGTTSGGYGIVEWVFVKNPPSDDQRLIEMMLNYREKYGVEIDSFCALYSMFFFRYDSDSEIYLKKEYRNDPDGVTYTLGEDYKFRLGQVFIEPCISDSSKWQLYVNVWHKQKGYYGSYFPCDKIIDSCAVMIDDKFVLSEEMNY